MQVRPAQLAAQLARGLSPVYVVHGDEPLLAIEAGDAIRAAARAAGYDDREILVAESGFKWDALAAANRNLGLFGSRKLIDLRIPGGKPGLEGGRVLEDCARHPSADTLLLITLPRLDRAASASAWFSALDQAGVTIAVYAGTRRAAAMDRGAAGAAKAACFRRHAAVSRRYDRGQPARRPAGGAETGAVAA